VIACLTSCVACLACTVPSNSPKAAPDFARADSNGALVRLTDYKSKVVLLDLWATYCGGCKTEIPWFIEFNNRYQAGGLVVIGVAMDNSWKPVKSFIAEERVNYTVVLGSYALLNMFGATGLPATFLIDRNGRIAKSHVGVVDKDSFEAEIRELLSESRK